MRRIVLAGVVLMAAAPTSPASACPTCAAGVRAQVRRGIFGAGFGFNLAMTVAPFAIFGGVAALLHAGFPFDQPRAGDRS